MLKVLPTHRYSNSMDIETPSLLLGYMFILFLCINSKLNFNLQPIWLFETELYVKA